MAFKILSTLGLLASIAISAIALPTSSQPLRCEDFGECEEVEVFGYRTSRLVNSTVSDIAFDRRQDGKNTNLEAGKDKVEQTTTKYQGTEAPPAVFGELWDRITEACYGSFFPNYPRPISLANIPITTATTCDQQSPVTGSGYQLTATGQFASSDARDNFISLLREAFFRTVTEDTRIETNQCPIGPGGTTAPCSQTAYRTTRGVDFLNANIFGGPNSGQFMTVRLTRVSNGAGCPSYLNAINSAGALVPGLQYFFGGIATACAAIG